MQESVHGKVIKFETLESIAKAESLAGKVILFNADLAPNKQQLAHLMASGLEAIGVYGGSRDGVYDKIDNYLREIDCDNMPQESWASSFCLLFEGILLSDKAPRQVAIIANNSEREKLRKTVEEYGKMDLEDIREKSAWTDRSAPSRINL